MNKAELSKMLDQKVQEKLQDGYSITTYALDAATRDRVKRALKPQPQVIEHQDDTAEEWHDYLSKVEAGTYQPDKPKPSIEAPPAISSNNVANPGAGSVGQWRVRRR